MIDEVLRQRREAEASALAGQALAANGPVMPVLDAPVVNAEDPAVKTAPLKVDSSLPVMAPAGGAPLSRVHAGIGAPLERVQAPTGKASVYGAFAYDPDAELNKSINELLQAQYQATEKRRTDAAKMAQIAALGNVLQTAFAPVGWIGQKGATSRVANPDSRQYITAFNEALKAQQDLGNIGMQAAQMRLNMASRRADRAYNAQLQRENRAYQAQLQKEIAAENARLRKEEIDARNAAILEQLGVKAGYNQAIQDRYDAREASKHGYRSSEANQRAANTKDINTAKANEQIRVATEKSKLPSRSSSGSGKKQSPTGGSTKKKKSPTA